MNDPNSPLFRYRRGRHTQYLLVALNQFRAARHLPLAIFNAFLVAFNKVSHSLADVAKSLMLGDPEIACKVARKLRRAYFFPSWATLARFWITGSCRQAVCASLAP